MGQFQVFIHVSHSLYVTYSYPPRHIDRRLTKLFSKYLSKHFILPMLYNSGDFGYLCHQLLRTSTHAEYDKTTDNLIIHNQTRDKNIQSQVMKPVDNKELTTRKRLVIHQRHEKRLGNTHRHVHELWSRTFHQTDDDYCSDHWKLSESQLKTRIDGQDDKTYPRCEKRPTEQNAT
ncbi:unnamed protein product [Rotaria magnacalcarata]